jgi:hypothetical protein
MFETDHAIEYLFISDNEISITVPNNVETGNTAVREHFTAEYETGPR